jgi:hypothetical protein
MHGAVGKLQKRGSEGHIGIVPSPPPPPWKMRIIDAKTV